MKKKKIVALLLGTAMIVGSLAGCGGGGSDSSDEPKKTADGATELEFWTFTEIHGDFYETMAEKWNEANPDKKVSINVNVYALRRYATTNCRSHSTMVKGHRIL